MEILVSQKPLFILFIQGLLMVLVSVGPFIEHSTLDFSLWPMNLPKLIGATLNLLGLIILISAVRAMNKNFEIRAQQRSTSKLVKSWPFSWVRNPTYLGGLMMSFGWSISLMSYISFCAAILLTITLMIKIKMEEHFLKAQFGKEYEQYLTQVPRIFPTLKK